MSDREERHGRGHGRDRGREGGHGGDRDQEYEFIERIVILDRQAFGRRVMEWSAGTVPVPRDLDEAEQQLTGILQFPLPSYITALNFVPTTKEVWTIKLPPADMLQDTRNRIASPDFEYTMDPTYAKRVHGEFPDDLSFFEFRVGDYTCSLCA